MSSDLNNPSKFSSNKSNDTFQSISEMFAANNNNNNEETFNLEWLFAVFIRRLPVMIVVAIALTVSIGIPLVKKAKQVSPIYGGTFRLLIEPTSVEGRLTQQFIKAQTSGVDVNRIRIEDNELVDYETQIRVLKSQELIKEILAEIQKKYPGMSYDSLNTKLKVKRITYERDAREYGTKIIEARYTDEDIEKINFVLNIVADSYLEYSLKERVTSLRHAIGFLQEQLPIVRSKVNKIQDEFQTFREQNNIFNPDNQTAQLALLKRQLEQEKLKAEVELVELRENYARLQEQLALGNFTSILSEEEGYGHLLAQAQKLQSQVAIESGRLREDSIPMQTLREQERKINLLLSQEAGKALQKIAVQIDVLEKQNQQLGEAEFELTKKIKQYPSILRRYDDLQRELEVATDALKEYLSKLEALRLDAAQQEIPWQLIAKPKIITDSTGNPVPTESSSTKRQLIIVAVLSILLGVGSGFLVEVLIPVFHTPEEVTAATKVPLLGVIPLAKQLRKNNINFNINTPVAALAGVNARNSHPFQADNTHPIEIEYSPKLLEAFRSLYTNIRLLTYESSLHSLVISSAAPGEGKSTITVNLARIAASVGQRVLLVDADMRVPQLHNKLGLPNLRGLSDVITTDLSLNDAIQRWPEEENLFVLTAGQIPLDPIKLLSSKKMRYLMEQFQAFFDLVIYDSPSLVGLADSNLVAAQTDGIVLVVKIEKTDRSVLSKALEGLKIAGSPILGVVVNGAKG
ncbi:MAG: polysaccharide biosynthesis tyrosine autokinase [Cyanobacteriota bacterium]|nr:polysaccharide biosynthesis tyrosine autokinase [Cyanobacteriota bacterium]